MNKLLLSALVILSLSTPVLAEDNPNAYKWTDSSGQVHFGDKPPEGTQAQKIEHFDKAPSSAPQRIQELKMLVNKQEQEAQQEEALKQRQKEEERIAHLKKINCDISQKNLNFLKSHPRVSKVNAKGENSIMTQDEINEQIKKSEEDVKLYCAESKESSEQ